MINIKGKKELVHKPNETIMITNKEITIVQRKAYNVILYQAQQMVKQNPNQILFKFSIADLKEKAGINATNNVELKKSIERLKDIKIETVYENRDWSIFSLIAQAEKIDKHLEIQLPEKIRQALLENNYYTTLDLMIIKNLQGKYAIILYEFAVRYQKVKLPELSIQEFRKLTGTDEVYKDFGILRLKTIEPALAEINEKTDIIMRYEVIKTGRSITSIKFFAEKKNEDNLQWIEPIEAVIVNTEYSDEVSELFSILPEEEKLERRKKEIETLLKKHTFKMLKADIEYCNKQRPEKYWAYFKKSLKNGHYSSEEVEKKEKIKAKQKEKKEIEKKEIEIKENKVKELSILAENVYNSLNNEMMEEYIEKSGYRKLPEKFRKNMNLKDMIIVLIKKDLEEEQ